MRPEHLRDFAARSRVAVAAAKRDYWRAVAQQGNGLAVLEAAQALYEHAQAVSNFPDAAYLANDFAHQVRLKELLDRASQAIAARRAAR